ncbi:MAG: 4-hydroxybenzoate octaprenyltransferase [Gemmatimonadetes bacterium]|nr:MAG: 4-hydroxybenzoate octaprenyltransferase [Gemmatimonadota bacterium]
MTGRLQEGQTFTGTSRFIAFVNLVRLPHTVFALPFALIGVVLASYRHRLRLTEIGWVILAFTAARFAAMAFNRIVDRHIDAQNPRTSMRELPRGVLSVQEAWISVVVSVGVFLVAAAALNPLCLALAPLAILWVLGYSFTKRFTRWSHLVLGAGLGIAPVGGYLAVAGAWSHPWWLLVALSTAVTTWVGGFDILYALPDEGFDRAHSLHSIPAALGERRAIYVARGLHAVTIVALLLTGIGAHLGPLYWCGLLIAAAILLYEHSLVHPGNLTKLDAAFFMMNGMLSITLLFFVLAERIRPLLLLGWRR